MARIVVEKVTIDYPLFGSKGRSLKNVLLNAATGGRLVNYEETNSKYVRALDNFSIVVNDGDRIGITGHNGAGKSTLLRTLAGIYKPTKGTVDVDGNVGVLLDLSAGIEPESTGLENIYLRGYILGRTKSEIKKKINEIVEFSELGDFINIPVKTYSAGMLARLAFSISTSWNYDILLIDEGIGAGDQEFQKKVKERVSDMFRNTSILILASHSTELIELYCNRKITMEHGRIK